MPILPPLTKEEVLEKIEKGESFEGVEIGDVDFSEYSFDKPVDFYDAIFKGNANFDYVTFKTVSFRNTKFEGVATFDSAKFEGKIDFYSAKFEGGCDFNSTKFEGETDFDSAKFEGETNFDSSKFEGKTYFSYATFKGHIYFSYTTFEEYIYFTSVKFEGVTTFDSAKFKGETSFLLAEFKGRTYFTAAKFEELISFDYVNFERKIYFSYSTFRNIVNFKNTSFNSITNFDNTIFEDRAHFEGKTDKDGNEENLCFKGVTNWSHVRFLKPKLIDFTSVDFRKCKLSFADFSSVNLEDIQWAEKKKRKVIYDEIETEKNIDYPIVENAYRRLKKNYENSGNYPFAGDFHYGEMEMKRLAQNKFFRWFSLTTLYKIFSGYGEKLWRSLLWLVLFFLFFTFSYLFTGLQSGSLLSESGSIEFIKYNFSFDFRLDSAYKFLNDFCTALTHSFEVITFKRIKLYETNTNLGRIFEFLQFLFTTIFVTLSIMAIKRKFRR